MAPKQASEKTSINTYPLTRRDIDTQHCTSSDLCSCHLSLTTTKFTHNAPMTHDAPPQSQTRTHTQRPCPILAPQMTSLHPTYCISGDIIAHMFNFRIRFPTPPPLRKHKPGQESDGQTGSWCLDKVVQPRDARYQNKACPENLPIPHPKHNSRNGALEHNV